MALLIASAAVLPAAAGCSSLQGTGNKGFVTGDGSIHQVASADRGRPVSLTGKDLDGRPLSLASFRGKPSVVNVWGSWCTSCRAEAPLLVAAHRQLGDTAHFVGIDVRDPGTAQAKAYESHFGTTWPSYWSKGGEALLSFPGVLTPNTIPATVVLDARGRVAASFIGEIPSALTLVEIVRDVARRG
ncbi:MAG: TlpA disulfide reductase family protein [Nocardioides sp.]